MRLLLIPAAVLLMAADWTVDHTQSSLTYEATQEGTSFTGSLPFDADITFDPDTLKDTHIVVKIPLDKGDAGSDDRNETLSTEAFFDIAHFPVATFTATDVTKSDAGFIAKGTLSLKGISQPVTLPFTLTPENTHTRVKGETTLSRKAFSVGTGSWEDEGTIGDKVVVKLNLVAHRQ